MFTEKLYFSAEKRRQSRDLLQQRADGLGTGDFLGLVKKSAGQRDGFVEGNAGFLEGTDRFGGSTEISAEESAGFAEQTAKKSSGPASPTGSRNGCHHGGCTGNQGDEFLEFRAGGFFFEEIQENPDPGADGGFGKVELRAEGFDDLFHVGWVEWLAIKPKNLHLAGSSFIRQSELVDRTVTLPGMGGSSTQPALFQVLLVPAEEMAQFVQQSRADFLAENLPDFLGKIPEVFQPETDARCGCFRRALVE